MILLVLTTRPLIFFALGWHVLERVFPKLPRHAEANPLDRAAVYAHGYLRVLVWIDPAIEAGVAY